MEKAFINKFFVLTTVLFFLQGCATYRAHKGFEATDLSRLHINMPRSEIEAMLGKPVITRYVDQGAISYYVYNRGYVPPIQKEGYSPIWTLPLGLYVDAISFGGYFFTKEEKICQRGLLAVLFNTSDVVQLAKENVYYDEQLSSVLKSSKRGPHCKHVLCSPRPSSLPDELRKEPWPFDFYREIEDCN